MSGKVPISIDALRSQVRDRYAATARAVRDQQTAACCGPKSECCGTGDVNLSAVSDYDPAALNELPHDAVLASLGCGNPTALAELLPGETVLDLGSGGGIDVLLSAKRVGPEGAAIGLDMTDEMLELAERNRAMADVQNVRFLKGHIEEIPLPDASVDVIISNCVINLSGDKDKVLAEAFRVLKPGGRFAVADIVVQGRLLLEVQQNLAAWSACVAGALSKSDYQSKLAAAGFIEISIESIRTFGLTDITLAGDHLQSIAEAQMKVGQIVSAFIRAQKPLAD